MPSQRFTLGAREARQSLAGVVDQTVEHLRVDWPKRQPANRIPTGAWSPTPHNSTEQPYGMTTLLHGSQAHRFKHPNSTKLGTDQSVIGCGGHIRRDVFVPG